jgi:hypothetical protein
MKNVQQLFSHRGNTNQSYIEIPFHHSQKDYHQNKTAGQEA